MKKTTQKELRNLIANGNAKLLNYEDMDLYRRLIRVAVATGKYGVNGVLYQDVDNGRYYAVPERNGYLFYYGA